MARMRQPLARRAQVQVATAGVGLALGRMLAGVSAAVTDTLTGTMRALIHGLMARDTLMEGMTAIGLTCRVAVAAAAHGQVLWGCQQAGSPELALQERRRSAGTHSQMPLMTCWVMMSWTRTWPGSAWMISTVLAGPGAREVRAVVQGGAVEVVVEVVAEVVAGEGVQVAAGVAGADVHEGAGNQQQ